MKTININIPTTLRFIKKISKFWIIISILLISLLYIYFWINSTDRKNVTFVLDHGYMANGETEIHIDLGRGDRSNKQIDKIYMFENYEITYISDTTYYPRGNYPYENKKNPFLYTGIYTYNNFTDNTRIYDQFIDSTGNNINYKKKYINHKENYILNIEKYRENRSYGIDYNFDVDFPNSKQWNYFDHCLEFRGNFLSSKKTSILATILIMIDDNKSHKNLNTQENFKYTLTINHLFNPLYIRYIQPKPDLITSDQIIYTDINKLLNRERMIEIVIDADMRKNKDRNERFNFLIASLIGVLFSILAEIGVKYFDNNKNAKSSKDKKKCDRKPVIFE